MPLTSEQLGEYLIEIEEQQQRARIEAEQRGDKYYQEVGEEFERHPMAMRRTMGLRGCLGD